jgi:hypothetical protein
MFWEEEDHQKKTCYVIIWSMKLGMNTNNTWLKQNSTGWTSSMMLLCNKELKDRGSQSSYREGLVYWIYLLLLVIKISQNLDVSTFIEKYCICMHEITAVL